MVASNACYVVAVDAVAIKDGSAVMHHVGPANANSEGIAVHYQDRAAAGRPLELPS